jgi:hypothetical protein
LARVDRRGAQPADIGAALLERTARGGARLVQKRDQHVRRGRIRCAHTAGKLARNFERARHGIVQIVSCRAAGAQ